ncbi:helix-turn-helix domain-containing protein, partial [Rhodanobacter thiooxydans]
MTVGDRIKQKREALGWSRTRLAKETAIPYSTLASIENGDARSSANVPAIAAALRRRHNYSSKRTPYRRRLTPALVGSSWWFFVWCVSPSFALACPPSPQQLFAQRRRKSSAFRAGRFWGSRLFKLRARRGRPARCCTAIAALSSWPATSSGHWPVPGWCRASTAHIACTGCQYADRAMPVPLVCVRSIEARSAGF